MGNNLTIQESIEAELIPALFKNFDNSEIALLELLDNAIDDRIDKKTLQIAIEVNNFGISIINKGGKGMGLEELKNFFKWGRSSKLSSVGHLGRYGQGGKAAMGYLARSCQIEATKENDSSEYLIEIKNWGLKRDKFLHIDVQKRDADSVTEGRVKIALWNLNHKISILEFTKKLGETYSPLIRSKKIKIWLNNTEVMAHEIEYVKPPKTIEFEAGEGNKCIAEVGIIHSKKGIRGGLWCYEFGRLITKGVYFKAKNPEDKYSLENLSGEVFINFDIPLIMNKTNFDRSSHEWVDLSVIMTGILDPWVKEIMGTKKTPSVHEKAHEEKINRMLKIYRTEQVSNPPKEICQDVGNITTENVGSLFDQILPDIQVEIRSLDKHLMYQVVIENGVKKILINMSYPPYKIWQSNTELYVVLAVAIELSKSRSSSIDDFFGNISIIFEELSKELKETV